MNIDSNSKTHNSYRNVVFGFLLKLYQLLMPFVIRTIIIYILGIEYAGLNSLFTSVLSVLNIAELGVGTIMVFYMYKPIAENNISRVCALMNLYKIYYRVIGIVILILGLLITPFLPFLIKGDVPTDINIYILYYLNLGATVLSYWLFSYKKSLFQAHQRNDLISKVTIITDTVKYVLQILLLCIFKNYYYYTVILLFIQILNNIIIAIRAHKFYPQYNANGSIDKQERKKINSSIKDIFYSQFGMVITLSVDSIIISAFLGLVPLAKYQNYYFIINALIGFFTIFYQSLRASIGTNIIIKDKKDNYIDFKFITFIIMGALTFCSSCLLNLYQPFIELWVGPNNLLDFTLLILLVIYFFTYEFALMIGCYKDISGKWHSDRFRPLVTAIVNLFLNILMVQFIGLHGVILSTVVSFWVINIPWLYKRVFIDVFDKRQSYDYFFYLLKKVAQLIFIVFLSYIMCNLISIYSLVVELIFNLILCSLITVVAYYLFNKKDTEMKRAFRILKKIIIPKKV